MIDFGNIVFPIYEIPEYCGKEISKNLYDLLMKLRKKYEDVHKNCFSKDVQISRAIEKKYNLSGMGMHYGVLQGGHYTAMCHIGNGTFLHYDDLDVTNVTKDDPNRIDGILEKNNSAYIIAYELI